MGGLGAPTLWARHYARRRWRSLVIIAVLAGLTSGLAMAAAAGARRTDTALGRLETLTRAQDALVFTSQVGDFHPDWRALEKRPEVARLAIWDLMFGNIAGQPGGLLFVSHDGTWFGSVDRPVIVQGRMFNPQADEMVVDEQTAAINHVRVGDVVPFQAFAPSQSDPGAAPAGPSFRIRVVGVVRDVDQFLFASAGIVSPGVVTHYGNQILLHPNAVVRLTHGEADVAALRRDVNSVVAPGVPVLDLDNAGRRVTTTLAVERFALAMLAAAIAVAGALIVLQVLVRSISVMTEDVPALRAMGMTSRDVAVGTSLAHGPAVALGAALGLIVTVALSPAFPIGEGRHIDPDVGLHADWVVIALGSLVAVVLLMAVTVWRGHRADIGGGRRAELRPSGIAVWLRRRSPFTVGLGAHLALEQQGAGSRGVSGRPALVGTVVGVLGVIAALTIDHAISDALANPQRVGVTWAAEIVLPSVSPELVAQVQHAAPGASVAVAHRVVIDVGGVGVPTFSVRNAGAPAGPVGLTTLEGSPPIRPDEADMGPATARQLHLRMGQWATVAGSHRVHLVGIALFPTDVHSEFDEGLWLTPAGLDAIAPPATDSAPDKAVVVRFPDRLDQEQRALQVAVTAQAIQNLPPGSNSISRLIAALGGPNSALGSNVTPPSIPLELTNLQNVELLPTILGISLAVLALAALSYVLVVTGRARRRDFAVMRAMGLDRRGSRLVVLAQASVIAVVALVVGVPLGVLVARIVWREVSNRVPLLYVQPASAVAIAITVPAFLIGAAVVAAWPAFRVAQTQPASVLRTE
jgi:ABC-type lipoprotein release transport system permease subunit